MIGWLNDALAAIVTAISVENPMGLLSICLLAISADVGIPFPFALDAILFYTVYKMGPFSIPVLLVILMLLLGRFIGTSLLYVLSRVLGAKFVNWLCRRSTYIRRNLVNIQNRSEKWSVWAIVVGRLTPGLMQVATVTAGSLRIPYPRLAAGILLSSVIYDGTLITLGYLARIGLRDIGPEYSVWIVFGFVVVMAATLCIIHLIRQRSRPY